MLAFGLNRNGVVTEDVEVAFRVCLLEKLTTLGRGRNRVEHTGIGDAGFRVIGNELVAVGGDPNAREAWFQSHGFLHWCRVVDACLDLDCVPGGGLRLVRAFARIARPREKVVRSFACVSRACRWFAGGLYSLRFPVSRQGSGRNRDCTNILGDCNRVVEAPATSSCH